LVAAFRATLEEISDSDLLVHVVDASNPRAMQQIESVEKILSDLELNSIPQIIVLNKTDLLSPEQIEDLQREISLDNHADSVAISAIRKDSLRPLTERIGHRVSVEPDDEQQAATGS
jgi:GTP-binding protein HflX